MEERNVSMTQDEMIQELITLLQKNNMNKSANEVFETAVYVDSLEKKLDAMAQELSDVRKQLVEMQEQTVMDSIKKSLSDAQQRAELRFNEMKESFMETKQELHDKAAEIVADAKAKIACTSLGAVRTKLGKDLNLCNPDEFAFAWIIDFPMFEWNEDENKWDTAHHMFTMPQEKYHATLESDPGNVKGDLYDLVLNGYELASGSIRIHDPELQKRIFKIVGFSEEEAKAKFGFLLDAFQFGPPPHGGIAPGLDRLVMLMCKQTSIKEVIAFPKNTFAISPMDECPSEVDQKQMDELHIKIVE